MHLLRWGLVPHWAKDPTIGNRLANARGESVAEKPAFREAFRKRRCLVPADGFYEWKTEGRTKQPYYFSRVSGEPLALAGLWESWRAPDGSILRTVGLITTAANALMEPIHERMPVILEPEDWAGWLEGPVEQASRLIVRMQETICNAARRSADESDDGGGRKTDRTGTFGGRLIKGWHPIERV
jgi:putative SOS response-associated peptidase YedK